MEEGKKTTIKRRAADPGTSSPEKKLKLESPISSPPPPEAAVPHRSKPKTASKKSSLLHSKSKVNALKPKAGSWLPHIAASVINRVVTQAMNNAIDPREHMDHINFDSLGSQLLSGDDMEKIWLYINREYPSSVPLTKVLEDMQPYSKVTATDIRKEELKTKYKDLMPKAPYSPYFLFTNSKLAKFKSKHPELSQTEIAVRLGQKWKALEPEQQKSYQARYLELKEEYLKDMMRFYEEHPDAKLLASSPKRTKAAKSSKKVPVPLTAEEEKLRHLRSIAPKPPVSAYISFCNKKRDKVHARHPELSPTDVTVKLGKKWRSLGQDERLKYQRHYEDSQADYKKRLLEFYSLHPEAKELLKRKPRTKASKTSSTNHTSLPTSSTPSPSDQVSSTVEQNGRDTPEDHEPEEEVEAENVQEEEEDDADEVETDGEEEEVDSGEDNTSD